jgi:hypothetical protein
MSYEPPPGAYPPPPPGPPGQPGQPGQPAWSPYGQRPQSSQKAIVALTLGCVSILLDCLCGPLGLIAAIAAIILGILARKEIARSGGVQTGNGMAVAGIATGAVSIVLVIALLVTWIVFRTTHS